jgi:hypothetical protein
MNLAICTGINQFDQNRLRDRDWSRQFLGSAWVTSLYAQQTKLGIEVASGDVDLSRVKSGQWRVETIHVVQEMDAHHGQKLCHMGAIPSVLTMLESPLVAYRDVDRLNKLSTGFAHCVGPRKIFERLPAQRNAHYWPLIFPSYWSEQTHIPSPWLTRKNVILIAANKYWRERGWSRVRSLKAALRILRHGIRKRLSPTFQDCSGLQLHDKRLDLIVELANRNAVDIFGRGWQNLENLPLFQAARLENIRSIFHGICENKHDLLGQYKFTIAFENTAYPGYVTEKIIDAMVAGSVPIYLGAPDIGDHVPPNAFIDASEFPNSLALADRLEQVTELEAFSIISAGQKFLNSEQGQRHTYEGFAQWIVSLASHKTTIE